MQSRRMGRLTTRPGGWSPTRKGTGAVRRPSLPPVLPPLVGGVVASRAAVPLLFGGMRSCAARRVAKLREVKRPLDRKGKLLSASKKLPDSRLTWRCCRLHDATSRASSLLGPRALRLGGAGWSQRSWQHWSTEYSPHGLRCWRSAGRWPSAPSSLKAPSAS